MISAMSIAPHDYLAGMGDPQPLTAYRLGILRKGLTPWDRTTPEEYQERLAAFENAVHILRVEGAIIVDPIDLDNIEDLWLGKRVFKLNDGTSWEGTDQAFVIAVEAYGVFNEYLGSLTNCEVKDIEGLIRWNENNPVRKTYSAHRSASLSAWAVQS
jgi:hypothetical protein